MAATLEIDELNTTGLVTHGVVNLNIGAKDAPNLVVTPLTAIKAGQNGFVKYNKLHFTDLGGASTLSDLRVWLSTGTLAFGEVIQTNLSISGYAAVTFAAPTSVTYTQNNMPTADPGSANLGIAGSLSGTLTAPGYSDIWKWQVQTSVSTPRGALATKTYTFQWDEA